MKPLLLATLLLVNLPAFSQVDSLQTRPPSDTTSIDSIPQIRCGPFAQASRTTQLIVAEVMIAGLSAYASVPGGSGPKVMGTIYAAAAAGCLIYIPFYWFNKENRKDPEFKKDRIWNTVTLLGMSVGYAGISRYNLARSDGHSFGTRFANNFLGVNATVIGSVAAGALVEKWLNKKGNRKVQTYLQWQGNGVSLLLAFK
ncbi:MAG TPA: hypothetical protein VFZ47_05265 [Chitinophagaceae bacterium]